MIHLNRLQSFQNTTTLFDNNPICLNIPIDKIIANGDENNRANHICTNMLTLLVWSERKDRKDKIQKAVGLFLCSSLRYLQTYS